MKRYTKSIILALALSFGGINFAEAQASRQLSVAFLNESIAFPFTSYSEFHPGFELGLSLRSVEKEHSLRTVNGFVGWFLHQNVENSFFLRTEYLHEFKLGSRLRAGAYGGVGYMHAFYPGTLYEMEPETGALTKVRQLGRSRALISTGIQISITTSSGVIPFLRQDFSVETPFANGIPVMPHSFLKIGFTKKL